MHFSPRINIFNVQTFNRKLKNASKKQVQPGYKSRTQQDSPSVVSEIGSCFVAWADLKPMIANLSLWSAGTTDIDHHIRMHCLILAKLCILI